jgi:hypothetical protein
MSFVRMACCFSAEQRTQWLDAFLGFEAAAALWRVSIARK